MASGQTANYNLNQWEAGDHVLRTEFNEDNEKIDGILAEKLGRSQLIRSIVTTEASIMVAVDLSDINWDEWEWISIFLDYHSMSSAQNSHYIEGAIHNESGPLTSYCSGGNGLVNTQPNPLQLVLLPGHDAASQVRSVSFANPGGAGVGTCAYTEINNIRFTYHTTGGTGSVQFPIGTTVTVRGAR